MGTPFPFWVCLMTPLTGPDAVVNLSFPGHSGLLLGVLEIRGKMSISLSLNCLGKSLVTSTCEWQPGKQTTHVGTASSHALDHVDTALGDPGTSHPSEKGLKDGLVYLLVWLFEEFRVVSITKDLHVTLCC